MLDLYDVTSQALGDLSCVVSCIRREFQYFRKIRGNHIFTHFKNVQIKIPLSLLESSIQCFNNRSSLLIKILCCYTSWFFFFCKSDNKFNTCGLETWSSLKEKVKREPLVKSLIEDFTVSFHFLIHLLGGDLVLLNRNTICILFKYIFY